MTFPTILQQMREAQNLSIYELAERSRLPRQVIWKAEKGHSVPRVETMRQIASGLGLSEGSKAYRELFSAWGGDKTGQSMTPQALAEGIKNAKTTGERLLAEFAEEISALTPDDLAQLRMAMNRPSVMAGLRLLNALYDEGRKRIKA